MPEIKLLDKAVAELIAAGEVVERPASVIKELVENSIDAGATDITVEIERGGITLMRVTDNGCGIKFDQVPTAFLRHATSKIRNENDLNAIGTLGFRGEALAAISSVSKVDILTATEDSLEGTFYRIEGSKEIEHTEVGTAKGTTIIIRDLFYNTPARMKFLKKDVSEGNAVAAVIDRIALSHPEIAFKFIRDGKQTLVTVGDNNLKSVAYSVLGREFASSLIEIEGENASIKVSGLVTKPVACKATRNNQYTFLNGRFVRSNTVMAAVEQAYKNSAMIGKFPGFLVYLNIPLDTVDVNVHPAKTEVRFSDEKAIFTAVYSAVKNALMTNDTVPQVKFSAPAHNPFEHITAKEYRQEVIKENITPAEKAYPTTLKATAKPMATFNSSRNFDFLDRVEKWVEPPENKPTEEIAEPNATEVPQSTEEIKEQPIIEEEKEPIRIIGEAFKTYIVAEMGNSVFMIDKHAAHERIIFNRLVKNEKAETQILLTSVPVVLAKNEYDAIISNEEMLAAAGVEIEDFGASSVLVRGIPANLTDMNVSEIISEIAQNIINAGVVATERQDSIYHTVACKAAMKAGSITTIPEMLSLAEQVLYSRDVMYCPHGRPVAFEIKKYELEKQFGRIQ